MKFKIKKIKEITIKLDSEEAFALLRVLLNANRDCLWKDQVETLDSLCSELEVALGD